MDLFAVIEDYNRPSDKHKSGDGYSNQVLAFYTSREAAICHLDDGVDSNRFRLAQTAADYTLGEWYPMSYYKNEKGEKLVRRIMPTWASDDNTSIPLYSFFLLRDDDASILDYI